MAGFMPGLPGSPLQGSLTPFKLTFSGSPLRPPQLQLPVDFFHMHVNAADGTLRCNDIWSRGEAAGAGLSSCSSVL